MSLEIILVTREDVPYWEDSRAVHFGDIDPYEWESLLFKDSNIMTYFEFTAEDRDGETYDDYYSNLISEMEAKFPLIVRVKDYYKDAVFLNSELSGLIQEIESLKKVVRYKESRDFLDQLLGASKAALNSNAGIRLVAD